MKSADCPFGAAAGVRARMPPPPPLLPEHVRRAMKLLAIGVGFVCGCRLGIAWTPDDAWQAVAPVVVKYAPLVAGAFVLGRRPVRRRYLGSGGRT